MRTARPLLLQAITRPFHYAIVDEVDSLLIDDCRNPMLISGPSNRNLDRFGAARDVSASDHAFILFTHDMLSSTACYHTPPVDIIYCCNAQQHVWIVFWLHAYLS